MKIRTFHIGLIVLLNASIKAQIVFLNNPSNHIVAFNPAFSAINPYLNRNYAPNQLCVSSRASNSQRDIMATGHHFFTNRNLGISAHYNYIDGNKQRFQKAGIGLSYQLIFFDEISTGWGIGFNYNQLKADSGTAFRVYNETKLSSLQQANYASVNFGWLMSYENIMAGFSFQPYNLTYFTTDKQGTVYTSGTAHIKYRVSLNRTLSSTLWYSASWNNIHNLQLLNTNITQARVQSHSLHVHLSGKKGLIGGAGCRITDFNYTSVIAKAGYIYKRYQLIYGIEPYWLHATYSEIIHELSFTLKLN